MGFWLSYTVYPTNGVTSTELQEHMAKELDDSVIEETHYDSQWVPPIISNDLWTVPKDIELGGAVGQRLSPNEDGSQLRKVLVTWLERCAESIAVAFILSYHDTSEAGTLFTYQLVDGRFQEIRSEMVRYEHDSEKGSWPEAGARLHPHAPRKNETDRTVDYLIEFEEEYGYRPMTFYG